MRVGFLLLVYKKPWKWYPTQLKTYVSETRKRSHRMSASFESMNIFNPREVS